MLYEYRLDISSLVGISLLTERTTKSALSWQKLAVKRLKKDKRLADETRESLLNGETIVAWINFEEEFLGKIPYKEMMLHSERVWKGTNELYG